MSKAFEIEIYGQRYTIRGEGEETYVKELARQVDTQMRTIASKMKVASPTKLAVLTALNLAHECSMIGTQQRENQEEIDRRAGGLIESIEETLGGKR